MTSTYDLERDIEHSFTIKCPCCNIETDLSRDDVPSRIRIKLLEEKRVNNFNDFAKSMEMR